MKRVLVLDSSRTVAFTIGLILEHAGFDVSTFVDCNDALSSAMESPPDLAVLDARFSDVSGNDVGTRFASVAPECSMVVLAGTADEFHCLQGVAAAHSQCLVLPKLTHPRVLVDRVKAFLK